MKNLYDRLKPLRRVLSMRHDGWTVWDCSPIYGPHGRVHVFATRWRSFDRPDATWYMGSQIVHAVAARPEGPYEVLGVVIEGDGGSERWDSSGVINAKIYAVGDQYCLLYTGCTAKHLDGPYAKCAANPVIEMADRSVEDPYVWHDGERFWMLVSEIGYGDPAGSLLSSTDGLAWSAPARGYPSPITFLGRQQRLEEPNLLCAEGRPTHLFNVMGACPEDDVYSGFVFAIDDPG